MLRTIVIATRNGKKFEEMAAILRGIRAEIKSPSDFGDLPPVPETGATFEENARLKAIGYARLTGAWALADDSGLEVDALGGQPGVRSSRWAGREGDDALNNKTLLAALAPHPRETWTARYRCVAALAAPDAAATGGAKVLAVTRGACEGRITDRPAGDNGFGYDPYFWVPGHGCTMAEIDPAGKNRISHRARALEAMKRHLEKTL
ncbi:MAG: RdgB/HAM1 family non-canonical purine NTP pyrophosphatase [Acidobacteria bacterium]|nr:RdgB/HAM1 family non-canonical purine NTP pyrophosphatase [Planctomycetota bacterium]MBE3133452.1 RdgB/HAM1 family non-canonical purine NTP pyrophosphatase [Acidobacteriota bacterium]